MLPIILLTSLVLLNGQVNQAKAQAVLHSVGATTICEGASTTMAVTIDGGISPYTLIYTDGTNQFTVNPYDDEQLITVSPTVTTTYSLVSISFGSNPVQYLGDLSGTVTITVNPLPTNLVVTVNPSAPVCPAVNFTISATATNGSTYELWNQANTVKISNLPYTTSIVSTTNYTVRAISAFSCTVSQALNVPIDNIQPLISCQGNQYLNTNAGSCNATLPDYRSGVTVSDNCTATGSIVLTQSPAPGTVLTGGAGSTQLITMTATDASGNSRSCTFTVTVRDQEIPVISGTATSGNKNTDVGQCYYTVSGTEFNPTTTSDNCGIQTVAYSVSGATTTSGLTTMAGVHLQKGANVILWTATDINGNTNTWTFTITVVDNQDPQITNCPSNRDLNMSAGVCTATLPNYIATLGITATDNCGTGGIVLTQSPVAGTILSGGDGSTQLITITATDASGKFSTCTFTVTVQDVENPGISCPSNITTNVDAGQCSAVVTYTAPVGTDNCSGVNTVQTAGLASGASFPVGTTTNTFLTTDAAGNTSSCSFTVTVVDNENPSISCPANITTAAAAGTCTAVVTYTAPTGTDNCPGAVTSRTAGLASGSSFPVGVTTNTFTVTDASGNQSSCSFTVTVTDNEVPVISNCPANITQANDANQCGAVVTWTEPTATDNCTPSGSLVWTKSHTPGSFFPVGTTTVTYTAKDASNNSSAACTFTVTVTDTQKPVISGCPANITKSSDPGICTAIVSWTEPSATDNCTASGSLVWTKSHTPGTLFTAGTTTVTYTATDAAGNISNVCSFTVTVVDNQKPVISGCPTNITVANTAGSCNGTATWTEPTATDNCTASGSLVWTKSHLPGATFPIGNTTVTYTVKDASNNVSNPCSFTVTVTESEPPVARCKPATIYLNNAGIATLTVSDVNDGSTDNCTAQGSLIITLSKTTFNCSNRGTNTVVMTVKDVAGNSATCNATVTVVDNVGPTITATAGTVTGNLNADPGVCYYAVKGSEFDPTATDNCSGAVLSYTVTGATTLSGTGTLAGKQLLKGANVITWNATDASGNSSPAPLTFTKTVLDNQAPTISSIGNQTRNTNTGCGYTVSGTEFDATYSDNCAVTSVTYTINSNAPVSATTLNGVILPLGLNNIVWTVSDGTNSRTSSFRVTVIDDDFPTISQMSNITVSITTGCGAVVTWETPTYSDNCSVTIFGQVSGLPSGSTFPIGTTQVRYWAKDAAGNTTYMSFNVIVNDLTPPVLTCPAGSTSSSPFVRTAGTGVCFYTVAGTEFDPTTDDGCAVTATNSFDGTNTLAGKQIPAGYHEIVWTATDGSNNSSTCTIYVQVNDLQNPTFDQPTGNPAGSYAYARYCDPGVCYFTIPGTDFDLRNVSDNCATETPTFVITKNGTTFLADSNSLAGVQLPKDPTYAYSIVWTLSDVNGNTVVSTPFTISVADNQPPLYVCHGNEVRTAPSGSCYYTVVGSEFDISSLSDNCDTQLTISYTLDGTPGVGTTLAGIQLTGGTHAVVWTVIDQSGNSKDCSFNVKVIDEVGPSITQIANQNRNAPSDVCYYIATGGEFDPTVSDNCTVTLTNNQNNSSSLDGFHFPVGITVVVWTATDPSGNAETMQFEVNVHDVTAPAYDLPATVTRYTPSNSCLYTTSGTEFDPQNIVDNCTPGNFNILNNYNNYRSLAFAEFPVGTTTVQWTVKDFYGNMGKKNIVVTVYDTIDPAITCPSEEYTRVVDIGHTYYTVGTNEFKPVVTDNCSVTSYTNSFNGTSSLNGAHLEAGTHTITWTAVDPSGNTTTCNVIVNVVTDLYPPITCVGDKLKNSNNGVCSYTVVGTEFNASSTSPGATLTNDYTHTSTLAGAVFPVGTYLVTWTASQTINGTPYTNSCSFYVFVEDHENPVITPAANVSTTTNAGCYASGVSLGTPSITDNCGINYYTNDAPSSYPVGNTNVTWWAQDIHGNISTAIQTVTVVDDDDPIISCPATSFCREADDPLGTYYTVNGSEFGPFTYWDCSPLTSYTNNFTGTSSLSGAQLPVGTNSVIWTATDSEGNSSSCTVTIVVSNTANPPVTCRSNIYVGTDQDVCTYTVQGSEFDITTTATPPPTLTFSNSFNGNSTLAGAVLPLGVTTITWTVTDGTNTNTCCTYTIEVYDDQNPSVTWPANVTVSVDGGSCTATNVNLGTPTATDNCGNAGSISFYRYPSGNNFSLGVTYVYWTAYDQNGRTVYHTQTVTVNDTIAPVIDCPSTTYYREFDNLYVTYYTVHGSEFRPSVSENCTLTSYVNNFNGSTYLNGSHLTIGDHSILWTATDASSNTDTCTVHVTIVDSFKPLIDCADNATLTANSGCGHVYSGTGLDAQFISQSIIPGRTLTHNLAGAPSNTTLNGATFPGGSTTVTWTAKQTIGGTEYTSTCSHVVTVEDHTPPVINPLPADITVNVDPGTCTKTMTLTAPSATDNCGSVTITNNAPNPFLLDTTNVRWVVTDLSGNKTVYIQKVIVNDNEGPVITGCPGTITVQASGTGCQAMASWPPLIATDECSGVASFTTNHDPGSLFNVDTTTVLYTATDNKGNVSTCSFLVVVSDAAPTISCVNDKVRNTNSGLCSYQVMGNEFDPTDFSDNCGLPAITYSFINAETGLPVTGSNSMSGIAIPRGHGVGATGQTRITWTATDVNGNTDTCSFLLTIEDHEAPVIVVPGNQTRYTDLHKNYYTVQGGEFDDVTATDNCGIVMKLANEYNLSTLAGLQMHLGENTVTWIAEDDKGNHSQAVFYAYVIDNEPPRLLNAPQNITVNALSSCGANVSYIPPIFIDNVTPTDSLIITISPDYASPGYFFPVGVTTVTYSIVDSTGNNFSYSFDVTVIDTISPTITCAAGSPFHRNTDPDQAFYTTVGTEFDPTDYLDNCNVEISNSYNHGISLADETFPVGITNVTWTATDSSNNIGSCTIQVIIEDHQVPVISHCPDATVAKNAESGLCYYLVPGSEYDPYGFSDNYGLDKLTYAINGGPEIGTDLNTTLVGQQIPVGTLAQPTTTVVWRLYDLAGNVSATCTTVFTVTDIEAPIVNTVGNQYRNTDTGFNTYTAKSPVDNDWDPVVTDNCEVATITYSIDGGAAVGTDTTTSILGQAFTIGVHTVIWTATDIHGNTSTGTYKVYVQDNENPGVVCNNISVYLDNLGNYQLDSDDIAAISAGTTDPGGIASITVTPDVFDCSVTGANNVILTVTDSTGNSASCTAVVTVLDTIAPTAICKNITVYLDVLGSATILASDIDNGSSDACGIASLNASQTVFSCSDVGTKNVTLTVTDKNGNVSTCTSTVTVVDDENPVAVCKNITVYLNASGNKTITGNDVDNGSYDNCASNLVKTVTPSSFTCANIGTNPVTLRVTDPAGNYDECAAVVTVLDTVRPNAICQNITVQLDATGNATITAAQVDNGSSDACGIKTRTIDNSAFTCANLGSNPATNTVTLTVTDNNNNVSTCTSLVTVVDLIGPSITCGVTGNQDVNTDNNLCNYTHHTTNWNASATDGCTTIASLAYALTGATTGSGTSLDGVTFSVGVTIVTWTAVDGSGNTSSCSFTVTVTDAQLPTAICKAATVQLNASGNATITASDVDNGSNDACGIQSLSVNPSSFSCANLGANTVTLTVTDNNGNVSTCTSTVTVQDLIAPVAICKNITVQLGTNGTATITGADVNNGSSDNCSIASLSVSPSSFNCTNIGTPVTVTLTATDPAGNTATCTSTVTVVDSVPPTAICKNINLPLSGAGTATITAIDINNGSSDACGIASITANPTSFNCSNLGANSVTLTVTDNHGNVSTCTSTVTVQDLIAPQITCGVSENQNVTTDDNVCTYTHSGTGWNATATDNCTTISSLSYTLTGATTGTGTSLNGVVFNKGVTTVTWTATDGSSNSSTCTFTVTVADDQNPTALCKAATVQLRRNGTVPVIPSQVDNASYDNCAIVTYLVSKNNVTFSDSVLYNCAEVGANTLYLKVIDAAGNFAVCSSTVTVQDKQGPTLDDLSDRIEVTDNGVCNYTFSGTGWDPTDNCDPNPTVNYTLSGATTVVTLSDTTLNGQVFNQGNTLVTWIATDLYGNTDTTTFHVIVNDNQNPTISCPANITQNVAAPGNTSATVNGITAPTYDDNCSVTKLTYALSGATTSAAQASGINLLSSGTFNLGTTTVTYVAYDAAGNQQTCTFKVIINALPPDAVTVSPTSIITYENVTPLATFSVVLPVAPTGTVVFDVASSDLTEGTVSTSQLTFTPANWSTPQVVTVTGVNDDVDDGDIPYTIVITTNQTLTDVGSGYFFAEPSDVSAVNIDNDVKGVTVTPTSITTTEAGGTGSFTIVLHTEPTANVTFTLSSSDLTEGDVTTPAGKSVTFTALNWNVPQTVVVTGIDDLIVDGNVPYQIITSNASSTDTAYNNMVASDVNVNNIDNDTPGFVVTPTSLTTSEAGTTATFTIVLTSKPATDLVDYDVVVDVASSDLTEGTVSPAQLTFTAADWNVPQTVTVTGVDDIVVDGTIPYTIVNTVNTTGTTDPNYDPLNPNDVSVNNLDNDAATLAIDNVTHNEGNSGTTTYVFTVTHSGAQVIGGYSVSYYSQNVTTKVPSDYTAVAGSLTFTGDVGETKTITVNVNGDIMVENNETFRVVLNTVTAPGKNVTIPEAGKRGTGTITNDDNATIVINDVSVTEGNSGTKTLTFSTTLSMDVEDGLTLSYASADNTATTADNDYVSKSGTLTFAGTQNEVQTIGVTINGDQKVELDETFYMNLSNIVPVSAPAGTITFADNQGLGTILNDDAAVISITGFTVSEAAGTANFTVTMDKSVQTPFTVDFATSNHTAIAGSDYTAVPTTTLTFGGANPLTQTVTVSITNDNLVEPTEDLYGTLSNLQPGGQSVTLTGGGATTSAQGYITDNESASLAINDVSVSENAGTATFTVTLTGNIQDALSVNYATANNTALQPSDYTSTSGTLTFVGGSTSGTTLTISVPIINDNRAEPTETYYVNLSGISGTGSVSIADNQGLGTITDDDPITLTLNGFTVTETNGTQSVNATITSDITAQNNIVLRFSTTAGTATAASDYTTQTNVSYTLVAGNTSVNVPISILGDVIAEPTETFTGTITTFNANNQTVILGTPTATYTILDNDVITINLAGFSVTETNATQSKNFVASMNLAAQYNIVMSFSTADGTAVDGNDYTAQSGTTVTMTAGSTSVNIPTSILGDLIVEPTETFTGTVTITNANGQQASIGTGTATATITDDDAATLAVSGFTVNEAAGTGTYTVTLSKSVQNAFTVDFATSNITALAVSDYTAVPTTTLTFGAANPLTQTINVTINDDDLVEPTETLRGTISNLVANSQAVTIATATATGTITDNDAASVAINDTTVYEDVAS